MVEFKYVVYDDSDKHLGVDRVLADKEFDNIGDAFDYAQDGLYTYIFREKFVDGELDEDEECVWSWDSTRDRDELIREAEAEEQAIRSEDDICEDIEVEVKADNLDELAEFARTFLGDNFDFFNQDFDEKEDDKIPAAELDSKELEIRDEDEVEEIPEDEEADESLESTVDLDLLDNRTPSTDKEEVLAEPVDANEIRAHEQGVKLDERLAGNSEVHFVYGRGMVKVLVYNKDNKVSSDLQKDLDKLDVKIDSVVNNGGSIWLKTKEGNEKNLCKAFNLINDNYSVDELMSMTESLNESSRKHWWSDADIATEILNHLSLENVSAQDAYDMIKNRDSFIWNKLADHGHSEIFNNDAEVEDYCNEHADDIFDILEDKFFDEAEFYWNSDEVKQLTEALNDNAVKDCKNYKLVAHCKEEKPVCDVERPLDKPLTDDPDITKDFYEDISDEEFFEAFGAALKDKHDEKDADKKSDNKDNSKESKFQP